MITSMPELPEVETIRRELAGDVDGRSIVEAWSHSSAKFTPALDAVGATVIGLGRRGKYLLFDLAPAKGATPDAQLIIHLGMTGQLWVGAIPEEHRHVRAKWLLDDGRHLVFNDTRRFGRLRVVPHGDHSSVTTLAQLGPEPDAAEFTPASLKASVAASSRRIKTQLLSQRPVAGLGNIYADEALWRARINPSRRAITGPDAQRLHLAITEVIAEGIANRGTTLKDYRTPDGGTGSNQHRLQCYGRGGQPCRSCGTELRSRQIDQRTTTWCPACQRS